MSSESSEKNTKEKITWLLNSPEGNEKINNILYAIIQLVLAISLGLILLQISLYIYFREYYSLHSLYEGKHLARMLCFQYLRYRLVVLMLIGVIFVPLALVSSKYGKKLYNHPAKIVQNFIRPLINGCGLTFISACFTIVILQMISTFAIAITSMVAIAFLVIPLICILKFIKNRNYKCVAVILTCTMYLWIVLDVIVVTSDSLEDIAYVAGLRKPIHIFGENEKLEEFYLEKKLILETKIKLNSMIQAISPEELKLGYFINKVDLDIQDLIITGRSKNVNGYFIRTSLLARDPKESYKCALGLLLHSIAFTQSKYTIIRMLIGSGYYFVSIIFLICFFALKQTDDFTSVIQGSSAWALFTLLVEALRNILHHYYVLNTDMTMPAEHASRLLYALKTVHFKEYYSHSTRNLYTEMFNSIFDEIPSYTMRIKRLTKRLASE
ncbi:hypothetical protein ENBRE01_2765 [Enteropsectra breve]|nr:hypothetical protein ENBRE01_2765 [Enteropsectra breve]